MELPVTPTWALALIYALHMLSTVVWIGGLSALVMLVLPAAQRVLDMKSYAALLENIQRRLDPIGWFCLVVLAATGMFQMSANPNYHGFMAIDNGWAVAILLKHGVYVLMIGVSAYISGWVLPGLRRAALRLAKSQDGKDGKDGQKLSEQRDSSAAAQMQRLNILLLRLNLVLAVLILALTALARAS